MKNIVCLFLSLIVVAASTLANAAGIAKPEVPYTNPYLAASSYPVTHSRTDFTSLAGPIGPTRRLRVDEVQWKTTGPVNGWAPMYSAPYPNGKRVIWVGGNDRVAKLDADTLEVLTTYAPGGDTYFGDEEIKRHIANMDSLDDKGFLDYNLKLWPSLFRTYAVSWYRLLSRDNELYLPHRGADGVISLQVYGDADAADPASKITLRREWKMPTDISKSTIFGTNMTSDGWIVVVTSDGALIVVSRDFTKHYSLKLPSKNVEAPNQDLFSAFVRNSISTDDHGGIYVVTRDNVHRVQWTGDRLSLDEADGAWSASYPNEMGIGSGTTPGLMGWGPNEDHLAVIADGTRGNNMVAFWREAIPADWKGLPGFDRRVAGITPIHFGVSKTEQAQIENAPVIFGYGAFFNNTYPVQRLPKQANPMTQFIAETLLMSVPGHEGRGGTMIQWNPQTRSLRTVWETQTNFASSVCTVSGPTETVYCWGARNREWTLEGTDWNTGKSKFHYTLGKSHRFNSLGGPIIIAPNGAVDCGCAGGLGMVRVKPKHK